MAKLTPNTILQRAADLNLRIDSSANTRVFIKGGMVDCGSHGLAVLDAFSRPIPLSEALERLRTRTTGKQDWMDLTSTIVQLWKAGVLQDETQMKPVLSVNGLGFDAPPIHVAMLNDRVRTTSFLEGIREVVRPGDVVVDIGTGTGVLAIAAARAGARHVYAIEASGIGRSARHIFEANGLADRITLLQGWSTQVSLPERADVLVSEIIGNEPLGELVLEVTSDALKRLVKPGGRLVPNKLRIFGLPVTIPRTELVKRTFTAETLQNWQSWYEISFGPLADVAQSSPHSFFIKPHSARQWEVLSEPIMLAQVEFKTIRESSIDNTSVVTANTSGVLNGLLIYFELELGPNTRLSTHPAQADPNCSWRSQVWIFGHPLSLQPGDRFIVNYKYRVGKSTNMLTVSPA